MTRGTQVTTAGQDGAQTRARQNRRAIIESPYASRQMLTQALDDDDPDERRLEIDKARRRPARQLSGNSGQLDFCTACTRRRSRWTAFGIGSREAFQNTASTKRCRSAATLWFRSWLTPTGRRSPG